VSRVFVRGWGAVSPAGWGMANLRDALARAEPLPTRDLPRPGRARPLKVRGVPTPATRPAFVAHARLRRTSPIAQYAVAASLEALGPGALPLSSGSSQLGIIFCVMAGCVNYSRRFYDEVLKDPALASPLVFPETVFNAPASHLASLLGTKAVNYTLVGDPGTYLQGVALAAEWLGQKRVDGCLVVGAEELDWLVSEAFGFFDRTGVVSDGAGALYLRREPSGETAVELSEITSPQLFTRAQTRAQAAVRAQLELNGVHPNGLLCDGLQGSVRLDRDEASAWHSWTGPRLSPKAICGEAFTAAAAWQCTVAVDSIAHENIPSATVSVVGCNQQAIAARFVKSDSSPKAGNLRARSAGEVSKARLVARGAP